jgi:hypothetical protein
MSFSSPSTPEKKCLTYRKTFRFPFFKRQIKFKCGLPNIKKPTAEGKKFAEKV